MPRTHESSLLTPRNLVLCAMIAFAVGYRLLVNFSAGALPWNFTPVEAMALFGGAYFADKRLAVLVPLAAMALSDVVIGFDGAMSLLVYACIAATAFAGFGLRGRTRLVNVTLAAIASATGFYLVTNFGVWLTGTMYPHNFAGLLECYVAGWPFYEYGSLPGTVLWSAALFGGFALLSRRYTALRLAAV